MYLRKSEFLFSILNCKIYSVPTLTLNLISIKFLLANLRVVGARN